MKYKYEREMWDNGWKSAQAVRSGDTARAKFERDYANKCMLFCDKSLICFDQGYRAFKTLDIDSNPYIDESEV